MEQQFLINMSQDEKSDLRGRHLHIVGQVDKCLVLASRICSLRISLRFFILCGSR